MWTKKQIKEFFFGPSPPPRPSPIQKDVGKIVATIYFLNGTTLEKTFSGENKGWIRFLDGTGWFPYTNNARYVYDAWLNNLSAVKSENIDVPFHQIEKIEKIYFENIVTVE